MSLLSVATGQYMKKNDWKWKVLRSVGTFIKNPTSDIKYSPPKLEEVSDCYYNSRVFISYK